MGHVGVALCNSRLGGSYSGARSFARLVGVAT